MPNTQILIIHNRGHTLGYTRDNVDYAQQFITRPYQKLVSPSKNVVVE